MTGERLNQLETETCSRCGGSGHYSYCQMYGTTCFKCRGAKRVYTKRGLAAYQHLLQLRSKPVEQFVPGDLIFVEGVPGFTKSAFHTVKAVTFLSGADAHARGHRSYVNGIECTIPDTYTIETSGGAMGGVIAGTLMRRGCTAEEKADTLRQALDYQATLTKRGTVAKKASYLIKTASN